METWKILLLIAGAIALFTVRVFLGRRPDGQMGRGTTDKDLERHYPSNAGDPPK